MFETNTFLLTSFGRNFLMSFYELTEIYRIWWILTFRNIWTLKVKCFWKYWSKLVVSTIFFSSILCRNIEWPFHNKPRREGGPGSFLHVWLIWKYFLSLNSRFLQKEDIAPCQKVMDLWRFAVGQLSYRNIWRKFGQNLVFLVHIFLYLTLDAKKLV